MDIVSVKGLNKKFKIADGELHVLKNIDLTIPDKALAILKGRSGSGKTTLINILGALDAPTSGEVTVNGKNITCMSDYQKENLRRTEIGYVFQSVSLIPMMSAFENVEFALRLAGIEEQRKKRAEECLKMVGLGGRMHHMPQEMSGGEQQRVAIARAIAHKPKILFADEPTAELDSQTAASVVKLFKELVEHENLSIVMTTHDMGLMDAGNVIFELEDGEIVNGKQ